MKMNEKILQCRKRMGLSQEELAQQLNTSRQAISKWELGDSQPELNNVIALAKLFGVTTDWLLIDTDDEPAKQEAEPKTEAEPQPEPVPEQQPQPEWTPPYRTENGARPSHPYEGNGDTWANHLPGWLGRLVRRYGWLAGVYVAVSGGGTMLIGLIAKALSNSMIQHAEQSFASMGFNGFQTPGTFSMLYDQAGAVITDPSIYDALGMTAPQVTSMFPNPVGMVADLMIILGLLTVIAGVVMAVLLKKKAQQG